MEAVFAQAREAEASGEELLVDEEWHAVELEAETVPVVIETHRNGASHAAKVDAGNGHHDEALRHSGRSSPGQSSWPRSRRSRPEETGSHARDPLDVSSGR